MDWYTLRVLAWRGSITMDVPLCLEAGENGILHYQFTSHPFTGFLKAQGIRLSMDGRGLWHDNIFVDPLPRSVKYEEVCVHAYESVSAASAGIDRYF